MPRNRQKDYAIRSSGNEPVSIADYRQVPWQQSYRNMTYDFRRWLYIGRPELDEQGNAKSGSSSQLTHADRDIMVEALRDAVWHMPARSEETKKVYCQCGLTTWFEYLDCRDAAGQPVYELESITPDVIWGYIRWLRDSKDAETSSGRLSYRTAMTLYSQTKAVLTYLVRQDVLPDGLFPRNPFPNSQRAVIGHEPYPKKVMAALMSALYKDIQGLRAGALRISDTQTLTVYLMAIAARTGRNPTPLS